jgi:hypothetical protein
MWASLGHRILSDRAGGQERAADHGGARVMARRPLDRSRTFLTRVKAEIEFLMGALHLGS